MAIEVLKNCKIWLDAFDLSGDHNEIAVAYEADEKEATVFGVGTHINIGGLKKAGFAGKGFWQFGQAPSLVGDVINQKLGLSDILASFGLSSGAEGELAYMMRALESKYTFGDAIGEIAPFTLEGSTSNNKLLLGTVMHNAVRTTTGNGTQRQLGQVLTGQSLYAGLHVIGPVTGGTPNLVVKVQSDTTGFPSPTDRITFAAKTAIGSEFATPVAGPITDDFWRVTWTITGTGPPSFPFVVIVAII